MGVIGSVGRRRVRARIALAVVYGVLTLGALTTAYPFLVMVSTGFKSSTDQNDNRLIPAYWGSEAALFDKYVDDKYAGDSEAIAASRTGQSDADSVKRYPGFLRSLTPDFYEVGFRVNPTGVSGRLNDIYQAWLRKRFATIGALNKAYLEEDTSWETIMPPAENLAGVRWVPKPGKKWDDWLLFKQTLSPEFRLPVTVRRVYQSFMIAKYRNTFSDVPSALRQNAKSFSELSLPPPGPALEAFRKQGLPGRFKSVSVESLWEGAPGAPVLASAGVKLPIEAYERSFVSEHHAGLVREMAGRNYAYVFRYLVASGGALMNTFIYCGLAIITTLFVNTLAAYALSRYPIKASGQILIFLLATIAFPAEVTMIPNFLLLKDLHLLNTYAALVLPAAASGYMIFLLKGFFDSLPQELYEAGALDGAPEMTMLRKIALPLSRPVLGYFALITFLAAYGNFIYAYLVAQDQKIWTVMVFVYQLSTSAPKYVMMAAFTLAALPTLVVFLCAQRVIMRGIVLPGER